MTRYRPKYPDGEYTHDDPCDQEGCDGTVSYAIEVKDGQIPPEIRARCSKCGHEHVRYRKSDSSGFVKIRWHEWALMYLIVAAIGPIMFADGYLWRALNPLSVWLQRLTGYSKYHLSLVAFLAGCVAMIGGGVVYRSPLAPWSYLFPLPWIWFTVPYMRWCWRQIRSGASEVESDTRSIEDYRIAKGCRFTRSFYMLFALLSAPLFLYVGDPFPVAVMLLSVGYYWLDSDFVPPSKRRVLDLSRRWVTGET